MTADEKMVRIFFELEREDDWPPASVESVWAKSTDDPNRYMIQNTPFFVFGATLGDVVTAEYREPELEGELGQLWFQARVEWGGHALMRLIFRNREAKDEIVAWLNQAGCICEGFPTYSMVALSVPPEVDQGAIQAYLLQREQAGDIYVEEAILR
jgi:hypothetical protein